MCTCQTTGYLVGRPFFPTFFLGWQIGEMVIGPGLGPIQFHLVLGNLFAI